METHNIPKLKGAAKQVLRKFTAIIPYNKEKERERYKINNLTLHLKEPHKKE